MGDVTDLKPLDGGPWGQIVCGDCGLGLMTVWHRGKSYMIYCANCVGGRLLTDEHGEPEWEDET